MNIRNLLGIIILFIFTSCQVITENNEEFNQFLSQYSDKRPYPNVLSEREIVKSAIIQIYNEDKDTIDYMLKTIPDCHNATIGSVILVEDYKNEYRDTMPYYYYITAVLPNNTLIAIVTFVAMDGLEDTGKMLMGDVHIANPKYPRLKFISSNDTRSYVMKKLGIKNNSIKAMKPVLLPIGSPIDPSTWGWAIKLDKPVNVKTINNEMIDASIFWIDNLYYPDDQIDKIKSLSYSQEILDTGFLSILTLDVFNPATKRNLKALTTEKIQNNKPILIPISTYGNK